MQNRWREFVGQVSSCCSPEFWYLYNTIKDQSVRCQDAVLLGVKTLLRKKKMGCCNRKWPRNNRLLRKIVQRNAGHFWDNVMYLKKICLRRFQLPHCDSVTFSYVDPLFVWIQHANLLHDARHELRWRPKSLHHPQSHERVYGAGVQYGLLLEKACQDVPEAGKVALINLSWDGGSTGYASRSATPICIQVMNCNAQSVLAVGLVGYLPQLDVSDSIKEARGPAITDAKHHVLQVST